MKKNRLILILLAIFSVGFISSDAKASFTVATFADPAKTDSNYPLFKADFRPAQMKLTGGWSDSRTGLTLQVPYSGNTFANAWFDMNDITITSTTPTLWGTFGQTDRGEIRFYADNNTTPLVIIGFDSGLVSPYGFGANEVVFTAANVKITGSEFTGKILTEEIFSFSFANLARLTGSSTFNDGFTGTAAFTSSAIVTEVPEPATIGLLCLGGLAILLRRKKHS